MLKVIPASKRSGAEPLTPDLALAPISAISLICLVKGILLSKLTAANHVFDCPTSVITLNSPSLTCICFENF